MKTKIKLIAAVMLVAGCWSLSAQTNTSSIPDYGDQISQLKAELAALQKQLPPPTNPPALLQNIVFSNGVPVATNLVGSGVLALGSGGNPAAPLLALLEGRFSWFATVCAWFAAVSAAVAPFRNRLKHLITDKFNEIASSSTKGEDDYLRELFNRRWYIALGFILRFAGISLPTAADLERAIAQQQAAVAKAVQIPIAAPAVAG